MIVRESEGYPYFLQEWGKHVWDVAERSPVTELDVLGASASALAANKRDLCTASTNEYRKGLS